MEKQNKVISAKFQIIYYVDSSSFQGGITDSLLAEALYINVRCISIIDSAGGWDPAMWFVWLERLTANAEIWRSSRIPDPNLVLLPDPDPGVKKAPDPGSATLASRFQHTHILEAETLPEWKTKSLMLSTFSLVSSSSSSSSLFSSVSDLDSLMSKSTWINSLKKTKTQIRNKKKIIPSPAIAPTLPFGDLKGLSHETDLAFDDMHDQFYA